MGPNSEAKKCESWFVCIESKSFCAAVECVDRGLDPFEHNLVVADRDRSDATVCLAVSPAMRAKGVGNRCKVSDIPDGMRYVMARPRIGRYVGCGRTYGICLRYVIPATSTYAP